MLELQEEQQDLLEASVPVDINLTVGPKPPFDLTVQYGPHKGRLRKDRTSFEPYRRSRNEMRKELEDTALQIGGAHHLSDGERLLLLELELEDEARSAGEAGVRAVAPYYA